MGPPGSGKGTRAKIIGNMYSIPVITTGHMLREAVAKKTVNGNIAKEYMNTGELVPDDIVINIMEERLKETDIACGFVLDGFPRSIRQAVALDGILDKKGTSIDVVLYVVANSETIVNRLSNRRSCPNCGAIYHLLDKPPKNNGVCDECNTPLLQREDDKEEIIRHRFEVYEKQTFPILERYSQAGKIKEISGNIAVDDIASALEKLLG
jgi:adenylate kinase